MKFKQLVKLSWFSQEGNWYREYHSDNTITYELVYAELKRSGYETDKIFIDFVENIPVVII